MPNNYEPIDSIYNSILASKIGKQIAKDNPEDKFKIGNQTFSKTGILLGGISLLGSLGSYNERNQRQEITDEIRNNSYNQDYVNVPVDSRYGSSNYDLFNNSSFRDGGQMPERYKELGFTKVDTPKKTPNANKSHAVVVKIDGQYKLIRFGQQGVSGSPKKEGESEEYKNRRLAFKARHAKNIAKGKSSAAWWANSEKW